MKPVKGKQYKLLDSFAFAGLGWGEGTIVMVVDFPHLPEFFGESKCLAVSGQHHESQADVEISTPVELLQPLETRRRRKRTPTPEEPAPRRRRRKRSG